MTKADFVWAVGFQGNTAIVNKGQRLARRAAKWEALLAEGYLRAAFCSALWDAEKQADQSPLTAYVEALSARIGRPLSVEDAKRLLGVFKLPSANVKVLAV
jgi:hypothetical protein